MEKTEIKFTNYIKITPKLYVHKILIASVFLIWMVSCRSNQDDCIESMMEKKGYTYKDAKDACEDAQIDTYAR